MTLYRMTIMHSTHITGVYAAQQQGKRMTYYTSHLMHMAGERTSHSKCIKRGIHFLLLGRGVQIYGVRGQGVAVSGHPLTGPVRGGVHNFRRGVMTSPVILYQIPPFYFLFSKTYPGRESWTLTILQIQSIANKSFAAQLSKIHIVFITDFQLVCYAV